MKAPPPPGAGVGLYGHLCQNPPGGRRPLHHGGVAVLRVPVLCGWNTCGVKHRYFYLGDRQWEKWILQQKLLLLSFLFSYHDCCVFVQIFWSPRLELSGLLSNWTFHGQKKCTRNYGSRWRTNAVFNPLQNMFCRQKLSPLVSLATNVILLSREFKKVYCAQCSAPERVEPRKKQASHGNQSKVHFSLQEALFQMNQLSGEGLHSEEISC